MRRELMHRQIVRPGPKLGRFCAAILVGMALLMSRSANAALVISAQSTTAAAGSTGNSFDVFLTNTGPSSVTLGGFSFELQVGPNITITSVNISTSVAPYIFGGHSLFGPVISLDAP